MYIYSFVCLMVIILGTSSDDSTVSQELNNFIRVFGDRVSTGWLDWSWDVHTAFVGGNLTHLGHSSLKVSMLKPWAGLSWRAPGTYIDAHQYRLIDFWAAGGSGGASIQFMVYGDEDGQLMSRSTSLKLNEGAWKHFSIPVNTLTHDRIVRLVWMDDVGTSGASFYLDDVYLLKTDCDADFNKLVGETKAFDPCCANDASNIIHCHVDSNCDKNGCTICVKKESNVHILCPNLLEDDHTAPSHPNEEVKQTHNTKSVISDSLYVNCYENMAYDRTFSSIPWNSTRMTVDYCKTYCAEHKFIYAGISEGTLCSCGNSLKKAATRIEADCSIPCGGNKYQICGDQNAISVYKTVLNGKDVDKWEAAAEWINDNKAIFGVTITAFLLLLQGILSCCFMCPRCPGYEARKHEKFDGSSKGYVEHLTEERSGTAILGPIIHLCTILFVRRGPRNCRSDKHQRSADESGQVAQPFLEKKKSISSKSSHGSKHSAVGEMDVSPKSCNNSCRYSSPV